MAASSFNDPQLSTEQMATLTFAGLAILLMVAALTAAVMSMLQ